MEKRTRSAKDRNMTIQIGLRRDTYDKLDRLRRAKSAEIGIKNISWNDYVQTVLADLARREEEKARVT